MRKRPDSTHALAAGPGALPDRRPSPRRAGILLGMVLLVVGAGCSARHYRRSSDREVYGIIQQAEQSVFGRTNAFTIDTEYSGRDPASIAPGELIESRVVPNRRVVALKEALELGVRHSRDYQAQKEQLYLTALSLTGTRYQFTPQFLAGTSGELKGTGDQLDTASLASRVSVSQLLKTGGRLSVALANDLLRYYTGSGSPGDSAISLISVNLFQPLLRGFGRNNAAVESLTQAERNVVYAIRSYSQFQNQFAVNIVTSYLDLLGQKDSIRNNYTNYLRRVETTRYLEERAVDRERQSAVDDARTAELSARVGYINSLAAYLTALDAFKIRIGLPLSESLYLDDSPLRDLEAAGLMPVGISRSAGFRFAVERHMDILNAIDRFEDSQRKIRVAADQLKADLNLSGDARLTSDPPTDYTKFDPNQVSWSVGLQLDLPLDRLRERNTYRAALVSFESQLRSLTLTLDNFQERIDGGLRTLEQQRLNYLNRQLTLEVARRRVDMNQILLEAGRVQIRDLRESQDSLIAAQNQVTATLVDYLQARLQLLLDLGVMRADADRFWLGDPLEGQLTDAQRGPPPLQMPRDVLIPPGQYLTLNLPHELETPA